MDKRKSVAMAMVLMFGVSGALLLAGCGSKKPKKRSRTLNGMVESIDVASGSVAMSWFDEKAAKTRQIGGRIAPETEIYIDGKVAELSDVREGDEVMVEGYKQGIDIVATRIDVIRKKGSVTLPTTKPVEQ